MVPVNLRLQHNEPDVLGVLTGICSRERAEAGDGKNLIFDGAIQDRSEDGNPEGTGDVASERQNG